MSDAIKALIEQRANAVHLAREINERATEEKRDFSAEERSAWDKANADIDGLTERITRLQTLESRALDVEAAVKVDAPVVAQGINEQIRSLALGQGFEARAGRIVAGVDMRALGKASATAGGNTVKTSFSDQLYVHLIENSGVLAAGPTVWNTPTGENMDFPKTTAHGTAALSAESAALTQSDPTFGKVTLGSYKYSHLVLIPSELLADTSVDLEPYIAKQFGQNVGNAFGVHLVTGTGSSQPSGIATGATTGVTGGAGVTGAFTADNLIDLFYSVIAPYRNSQSCGWLMKDSTMAAVRKLKDSQNRYLWEPSLVVGAPDTLLGKPVYTDPNVAAPALSAKSVFFGDMSAYYVRLVNGIRFERSVDYAFNVDQVAFRAILRGDGALVDTTGAVKCFVGNAA